MILSNGEDIVFIRSMYVQSDVARARERTSNTYLSSTTTEYREEFPLGIGERA